MSPKAPAAEEDALDLLQHIAADTLRPIVGLDASVLATRIVERIRQTAGGREVRLLQSRRHAAANLDLFADVEPPRPSAPPVLHTTSAHSTNPDLLRLIRDTVIWELSAHAPAVPMSKAVALADHAVEAFQGSTDRDDLRYIPKGAWRRQRENARNIYDEFRTSTYAELAARWNLSEMRIRQIVNEFRRAEAADRKARTRSLI
jgi:hypothetical protein